MASSPNATPSKDYVQSVLNYLRILYPNGQPIDPAKEYDSVGYPTYKIEVTQFMNLFGVWATDFYYDMAKISRMTHDSEKIATATWEEIRQMWSYMLAADRWSTFTYGAAIRSGNMRQILLRMKKLAKL
jgi:hypothetical protein